MAAKPWEYADQARAALRAILDDPGLGIAALSSGRLVANVLEDMLPEAPRERAILVMAAQAGLAPTLREYVTQGIDPATAVNLAVASLENTSPLDPDACRWVVTEFAAAIGLLGAEVRPPAPAPATVPAKVPAALESAEPPTRTARASDDRSSDDAASSVPTSPPRQGRKRRNRRAPRVNGAVFSPDGVLLATAGSDGTARLWNVADGTLVHHLPGPAVEVLSVAFSPDGRLIATAAGDGARLWDVATAALVRQVTSVRAGDVAFSADGQLLATAGGGSAQPTGVAAPTVTDAAARLWQTATGAFVRGTAGSFAWPTDTVSLSPDGQLLATTGGGSAWLWQVATGTLVRQLPGNYQAASFSPDGRLLATAGTDIARLWGTAGGTMVRAMTAGPARDIAFSPDGDLVATAGGGLARTTGVAAATVTDNSAWLWRVSTGALVQNLAGHLGHVQTVTFSPDGRMLVSTGRDKTTRLWDLGSAHPAHRQIGG